MKPFDEEAAKAGALVMPLYGQAKEGLCKFHGRNKDGLLILESVYDGVIYVWDQKFVRMVMPTTKHYIGLGRHEGLIKVTQTCESTDLAAISMPSSWEFIKVIEVEV